jgi:hypothetical protein
LVGSGFRMFGDRLDKTEDYEIIEEHNNDSGGGTLDPIISLLDAWIFRVTGYRIVAASIQDLFGAEVLQYKLGRPIELRHTVGKDMEDTSSEFRLSNQVYQLRVKGLETGNSTEGAEKERIPVEIETTFTFRIVNLWKVSFGINFEYFPQVIAALNGALREKVTGMTIDDLLDKGKQTELGQYVIEKNPELLERFGFKFVALIVEDVIPDPATASAMKARRDAELEGKARVRASELKMEEDANLATGKARYIDRRLEAIAIRSVLLTKT